MRTQKILAQSVGRTHQFIVLTDGTLCQNGEADSGQGEDDVGIIELGHGGLFTCENPNAYKCCDECNDDDERKKIAKLHLLFTVLKCCNGPNGEERDNCRKDDALYCCDITENIEILPRLVIIVIATKGEKQAAPLNENGEEQVNGLNTLPHKGFKKECTENRVLLSCERIFV